MKTYTLHSLESVVESHNAQLVTEILCEEPSLQEETYKILNRFAPSANTKAAYEVVEILYAFAQRPAIDDAAVLDPSLCAQPLSEPIYYSDAVKAIFANNAKELKTKIIEQYEFERAQHQLYILTGSRPDICVKGSIEELRHKHLRFNGFPNMENQHYNNIIAALHFFQFNIGTFRKGSEIFISFKPANFKRLNFYFTGKELSEQLSALPDFHLAKCSSGSAIALQRFMFDPKTLEAILARNNGKYNLENLMLCFAHIMLNANPWMDALRAQGFTFIPQATLFSRSSKTYTPLASKRPLEINTHVDLDDPMLELPNEKSHSVTGLRRRGSHS